VKANAGPKRNRKKLLKYNSQQKKKEYIENLPLPLPPVKAKRKVGGEGAWWRRTRGRKRGEGRGVGERGLKE